MPPKSASPVPYDTEQVPPLLLAAISPPTFVLFAQATRSWGRDSLAVFR